MELLLSALGVAAYLRERKGERERDREREDRSTIPKLYSSRERELLRWVETAVASAPRTGARTGL